MGVISWLKALVFGADEVRLEKQNDSYSRQTTITSSNLQNTWSSHQDILNGLEFCATLQLRTPLRVLRRHGEIHTDANSQPPLIALEPWEGAWLPKMKTLEEVLGVKCKEPPISQHSSDIGLISSEKYLPFLIGIRKIVEQEKPLQSRVDELRAYLTNHDEQVYIEKHGGVEKIIQNLFPRSIKPMPSLSDSTLRELSELGFDSLQKLAIASDKQLLNVKGIGKVKLKAIREHCADMMKDRDADRVDNVIK